MIQIAAFCIVGFTLGWGWAVLIAVGLFVAYSLIEF